MDENSLLSSRIRKEMEDIQVSGRTDARTRAQMHHPAVVMSNRLP